MSGHSDSFTNTQKEEEEEDLPPNFEIPVIPASELSYERALNEFFIPNLPFIISGATETWSAQHEWIVSSRATTGHRAVGDHEGVVERFIPNWEFLASHYGDMKVNVLQCEIEENEPSSPSPSNDKNEYGAGDMLEMTFNEVIQLWKDGRGKGLYIKDWHLPLQVRERARSLARESNDTFEDDEKRREKEDSFYETPDIFLNDWMDNYYTNQTKDDFTFVYFGTRKTFTPLHRDVYTSYSWSANILGRKSWYFIPPCSIRHCHLSKNNTTTSTSSSPLLHPDIRPGRVDISHYPEFKQAKVMHVIQEQGTIIYVPSNWFHCVENLDEFVISVNRNWCNETNLVSVFRNIKLAVEETREALSDIKAVLTRRKRTIEPELDVEVEFEEAVQNVLVQNIGWGWETFYSMVRYNLLHPPAVRQSIDQPTLHSTTDWDVSQHHQPPSLSPPRSQLKQVLSIVFADHEMQSKSRTRARSYDSALEAALSIISDDGG